MAVETLIRERKLGSLLVFLALTFSAALGGGVFTGRSVNTWYRTLRKPSWNPPNWLFGPVWTILYIMMAVSAWLVRRTMRRHPDKRPAGWQALVAWGLQLGLNVSWSWVFFGKRQIRDGVGVIGALWLAIVATLSLTARVSTLATVLLVPYLIWTSFASFLNYRVWQLNR
ncbi:MAG: TspO/MBR family protein [Chloroflexota bacterium]